MGQVPGGHADRRSTASRKVNRDRPVRRIRRAAIIETDARETPALIRYGATFGALALLTAVLLPVRESIGPLNIGLLYLTVVIGATTFAGRRAGITSSVLGFALFNFFLIPPYLTFEVSHLRDIFALFVFLGVSLLISWLLAQAREQAQQARQRADDVSRLYELSQAISSAQHPDDVLPKIAAKVAEVFGVKACWIFLPDDQLRLVVKAQAPEGARPPTSSELGVVQKAFDQAGEAGQGDFSPTGLRQHAEGREPTFLPLRAANRTIGVLGVADKEGRPFTAAERTILATFAGQAALALERLRLIREADRAEMLERTDKLKSALMSAVSHDLRTPLASITASVTSLLEPDIKWDEETQQDFLQGIYDEARRLNVLVGNLLDMSRIEGGALRPEKEWYSIIEVVEAVVQRLEPALADHRLTVNFERDVPLTLLDFSQIDQVLTNLLENAVKHTAPLTTVSINVRRTGDVIEVNVADTGAGVPPEELPRLFDKFYKVNSGKRSGGVGLGLAISKGLVEAHGGRIWANNAKGGGLEITFTLPIVAAQDDAERIGSRTEQTALSGGK